MCIDDIYLTTDLSRFGFDELKDAVKLLTAYTENKPEYLGSGIKLYFNLSSGNVFLSEKETSKVAMMNGNKIEQWHHCSYCGETGFPEDFKPSKYDDICEDCFEEYKEDFD